MTATFNLVARGGHPDFLDLPWGEPLSEWNHPRLVKMAHGMSRHIVRFVRYDDRVYALKETDEPLARGEYEMLRELREEHLPVVEPVGYVTTAAHDRAMLITRYLDFSLPYWYLFGREEMSLTDKLLDAAVVLLVRLHLENVFWGDCSLSNVLFRRDAGAMMAYLVDAETSERRATISDGMRRHDLSIAEENLIGGLLELQEQGRVAAGFDPMAVARDLIDRYDRLWDELTRPEEIKDGERWRIEKRIRHINDLGFDVEELSISSSGDQLLIKPILIEEGHHARELRRRTGLEVQENQARRLLADISSHRAWLERKSGRQTPAAVAAARWLADVYEPVVESIPADLAPKLEAAEVFHHVLEHRYYLSERAGYGVSHAEALADYIRNELTRQPAERQLQLETGPDDSLGTEADPDEPVTPGGA
ncbi:MAG: DUF4032 domain-containing protein [Actinomycetota bacterium]